jgi:hypothetical protein
MKKVPRKREQRQTLDARVVLREFTDAELGAAMRLILADPNFAQYGGCYQVVSEWPEQVARKAILIRQMRASTKTRGSALVAAFTETYADACDCGSTDACSQEQCGGTLDEPPYPRWDGKTGAYTAHCEHCDGQMYCGWSRGSVREFLGLRVSSEEKLRNKPGVDGRPGIRLP